MAETMTVREALHSQDAATFIEKIRQVPDLPPQYANYADMIERAITADVDPNTDGIQQDADLARFGQNAFLAMKERMQAAETVAAGASANPLMQVMSAFGEVFNMLKSGDFDFMKIIQTIGGALSGMFNSSSSVDQAVALNNDAVAKAGVATSALQASTSDEAIAIRRQYGSDVGAALDQAMPPPPSGPAPGA